MIDKLLFRCFFKSISCSLQENRQKTWLSTENLGLENRCFEKLLKWLSSMSLSKIFKVISYEFILYYRKMPGSPDSSSQFQAFQNTAWRMKLIEQSNMMFMARIFDWIFYNTCNTGEWKSYYCYSPVFCLSPKNTLYSRQQNYSSTCGSTCDFSLVWLPIFII